jgi:hypothetical protein
VTRPSLSRQTPLASLAANAEGLAAIPKSNKAPVTFASLFNTLSSSAKAAFKPPLPRAVAKARFSK